MTFEQKNTRSIDLSRVIDSVVPKADFVGERSGIEYGPSSTGFISTIGPFHVLAFQAALRAIALKGEHTNHDEDVDPRRVLAQPWHYGRMCEAIRLQPESPPPSITVDRYTLLGLGDYYTVTNGNHRSFAARCAGATLIRARVVDTWSCDPSLFRLHGPHIYQVKDRHLDLDYSRNPPSVDIIGVENVLSADLHLILQCLGCRTSAFVQRDFVLPPFKFVEATSE